MRSRSIKLAVATMLCLVAGFAFTARPVAPGLVVKLSTPNGTNPTILTATDDSGAYRVEKITDTAFKLVNFDSDIHLIVVGRGSDSSICVTYGGTNGPDPLPNVQVTVTLVSPSDAISAKAPDRTQILLPGDSVTYGGPGVVISIK